MIRPLARMLGLAVALGAAVVSFPTTAAPLIAHLTADNGAVAGIKVTIEEGISAHAGDLKFRVEFDAIEPAPANPTIGDLTGLFFNVVGDATALGLSISEIDVLVGRAPDPIPIDFFRICVRNNDVEQCGHSNNNLNGGTDASFDVGIEIGKNGAALKKGDIQDVEFFLEGAIPLTLSVIDLSQPHDFGGRIQSVGTGTSRGGSTKLLGSSPPNVVPEPATLALLTAGWLGLVWARRRRPSSERQREG